MPRATGRKSVTKSALLVLAAVLATAVGGVGNELAGDLLPKWTEAFSPVHLLPFVLVASVSGAVGVLAGYLYWLLFQSRRDAHAPADVNAGRPPQKRGLARLTEVIEKNRRFGLIVMGFGLLGMGGGLFLAATLHLPWEPPSGRDDCIELRIGSSIGHGVSDRLRESYEAAGRTINGRCVRVAIREAPSGSPSEEILNGAYEAPNSELHAWWPSSSTFVELFKQTSGGGHIVRSTPTTGSQHVIAMPHSIATKLGWPARRIGWADLARWSTDPEAWRQDSGIGDRFLLARANPRLSPSSLASVVMTYAGVGAGGAEGEAIDLGKLRDPAVQARFREVENTLVGGTVQSSTPLLTQLAQASARGQAGSVLTAVSVEEQAVLDYNAGFALAGRVDRPLLPSDPLVAFYPKEGTLPADHPFVVLKGPLISSEEQAAAADFSEFLRSEPAQERLKQAGFRDAAGQADAELHLRSNGVLALNPPQLRAGGEELAAALDGWDEARRSANALIATDTSSAVAAPTAGPGTATGRRLTSELVSGLVAQASGDDRLGLWTFPSGSLQEDYTKLVALGAVRDADHARLLSENARKLASPGRGEPRTPIYDTVLAGKQELEKSLGANDTGTLVLVSRGVDNGSGISKQQLLREWEDVHGPRIRVVAIRIGPPPADGRPDVLSEIATASRGVVLPGATTSPEALMSAILTY